MTVGQPAVVPPGTVLNRGVVKSVLNGDTVVIRGQPKGGPPPERTLTLGSVMAPRLARRPFGDSSEGTKDEPFAWEARERLREMVIGKDVLFSVEYRIPATGRECGTLYLGKDVADLENVIEVLLAEGLLELKSNRQSENNEAQTRLNDLQETAKSQQKGKWAAESELAEHVRNIVWIVDNPRHMVDRLKQQPQKAIIEHVRDGSTVRAFLLPGMEYVTVMLSGVKAPLIRLGEGGIVAEAEPFAEEARYFTESRLLQREVEIILEGVSNQNFIGSVLHPNGNIAELLLTEGFAKCVDWSITLASCGSEKLRAAEKLAKERRLRIWRSYEPSSSVQNGERKSFTAKVVEIVLGDSMMIRKDNGETSKISLSSVRAPQKQEGSFVENTPGRNFRPLYDIPFMFEAREFLRKRLIGKKVTVTVDYVQPKSETFPEKTCCTVLIGNQNVAEALVAKGLATVLRYRADDENRSGVYDDLLKAEASAEKSKKGIHALKAGSLDKNPTVRVQDLSGDSTKAKHFFPYFQRSARNEAIVEFVSSGSRLRLYVPKETCLTAFLLSGISCPRASMPAFRDRPAAVGEPFGDEAFELVKNLCLQHEVEIEVESMDKNGALIGYLFLPTPGGGSGRNLSEMLVEEGLASVHFTAERSKHYTQLINAEQRAKNKGQKIWTSYKTEQEQLAKEKEASEIADRNVKYRAVVVTDVQAALRFSAQFVEDGPKLEQMMTELKTELTTNPPTRGSYTPRKGELCLAQFTVDDQWYRAKVESVRNNQVEVLFIDFGNREVTDPKRLAVLPPLFQSRPAGAREFALALCKMPPEESDFADITSRQFYSLAYSQQFELNIEYRQAGVDYVTLLTPKPPAPPTPPPVVVEEAGGSSTDATPTPPVVVPVEKQVDIGKSLVEQGFALADPRRERRLLSLTAEYVAAQEKAKREHVNIWQYGDFTGDEL